MLVKPGIKTLVYRLIIILGAGLRLTHVTTRAALFTVFLQLWATDFSLSVTSSRSVLSSFCAAAAAAALGTWLTAGLEAMRTGVLDRISGGMRPGDTGLR